MHAMSDTSDELAVSPLTRTRIRAAAATFAAGSANDVGVRRNGVGNVVKRAEWDRRSRSVVLYAPLGMENQEIADRLPNAV